MSETRVTVYTPDSSLASPALMIRDMLRDLAASRELAWRLAVRDIRAQYRQAFFGIAWAFFVPLANTLTWIFLSGTGVVAVGDTPIPYPAYVFTGTILWAILVDAVNAPLQQTRAAISMLTKLNFPREAILISGIYQTLFNGGIKIVLLLLALLILGINPGWGILFFPLGVLSLILVGTAIGVLVTPVGMLYSDVGRAIPILMQFLMYLTPVVFPMPEEGLAHFLLQTNPFTPVLMTARDWATGMPPGMIGYFLAVCAATSVLLVVVWVAYRLAMPILIERMST